MNFLNLIRIFDIIGLTSSTPLVSIGVAYFIIVGVGFLLLNYGILKGHRNVIYVQLIISLIHTIIFLRLVNGIVEEGFHDPRYEFVSYAYKLIINISSIFTLVCTIMLLRNLDYKNTIKTIKG